jgi:hypothetical protein
MHARVLNLITRVLWRAYQLNRVVVGESGRDETEALAREGVRYEGQIAPPHLTRGLAHKRRPPPTAITSLTILCCVREHNNV